MPDQSQQTRRALEDPGIVLFTTLHPRACGCPLGVAPPRDGLMIHMQLAPDGQTCQPSRPSTEKVAAVQ
jgi:hypothetical protein